LGFVGDASAPATTVYKTNANSTAVRINTENIVITGNF